MTTETTLLPCPFCETRLDHIESLARSFATPRIYHEYWHPDNGCLLESRRWNFIDDAHDEDGKLRKKFIGDWNRRAS